MTIFNKLTDTRAPNGYRPLDAQTKSQRAAAACPKLEFAPLACRRAHGAMHAAMQAASPSLSISAMAQYNKQKEAVARLAEVFGDPSENLGRMMDALARLQRTSCPHGQGVLWGVVMAAVDRACPLKKRATRLPFFREQLVEQLRRGIAGAQNMDGPIAALFTGTDGMMSKFLTLDAWIRDAGYPEPSTAQMNRAMACRGVLAGAALDVSRQRVDKVSVAMMLQERLPKVRKIPSAELLLSRMATLSTNHGPKHRDMALATLMAYVARCPAEGLQGLRTYLPAPVSGDLAAMFVAGLYLGAVQRRHHHPTEPTQALHQAVAHAARPFVASGAIKQVQRLDDILAAGTQDGSPSANMVACMAATLAQDARALGDAAFNPVLDLAMAFDRARFAIPWSNNASQVQGVFDQIFAWLRGCFPLRRRATNTSPMGEMSS